MYCWSVYWSSRLQFRWAKNQQAREKRAEVRGQLRSISSFCAKADLVFDWWCLSFQGMREMDEKKKNKRRMEDDDEESQAIKMPSRKMKFAGLSKKKKRRNWSEVKTSVFTIIERLSWSYILDRSLCYLSLTSINGFFLRVLEGSFSLTEFVLHKTPRKAWKIERVHY